VKTPSLLLYVFAFPFLLFGNSSLYGSLITLRLDFATTGVIFFKYSININSYICMITHPYEYIHPTFMSIFEILSWLDLKIHKVGYQKRLAVDEDVISH
jgi:hypothetical protein